MSLPPPVKVPDALMSAMGFTVAELNPGLAVADPTAGPGSPEENGGHHPDFVGFEERETERLAPIIDRAVLTARSAYRAKLAEIGDVGTCGFADVVIAIEPATRPIIRTMLAHQCIGRFDEWHVDVRLGPRAFLLGDDPYVQSLTVQEAGCEALAAALRKAGCPCRVDSVVD